MRFTLNGLLPSGLSGGPCLVERAPHLTTQSACLAERPPVGQVKRNGLEWTYWRNNACYFKWAGPYCSNGPNGKPSITMSVYRDSTQEFVTQTASLPANRTGSTWHTLVSINVGAPTTCATNGFFIPRCACPATADDPTYCKSAISGGVNVNIY